MTPILEARSLVRVYRSGDVDVHALRGVSLEVAAGEFLAIMGPSGSGKSTLLHLLGGLDRPTSGEVVLDGDSMSQGSDDAITRRRRDRVGFVFQFFNLIPLLSARENVALPFMLAGADPRRGDHAAAIDDVLALLDLRALQDRRPGQLAAGEQQRVAIARALVMRPSLLLADEPTGNLDFAGGFDVLRHLRASCVERGQTVVLVTHDAKAAAFADRVLFMRDGQVLEEIPLGRRDGHEAAPLIERLALLGQ